MSNQTAPYWYQDYLQATPQIDLTRIPMPTTYWYMTTEEYLNGSQQMLADLQRLAQDGCIAAAWALSVFEKLSQTQ